MKVFVLGHRGMLGHVVARYLNEQGMQVLISDLRYTGLSEDPLIASIRESEADWVVNAIGKVDSKSTPIPEMMLVNAQLPIHLKSFLRANQRMLHASSDGVFSGRLGNYGVDAERDATDAYGFSKILGEVIAERGKALVVRASVIGPSHGTGKEGLLEWCLKQKNAISGFTNHTWNGITTLEWAVIAFQLMQGILIPETPLIQATSAEPISKFHLLNTIAETWGHEVSIHPALAATAVDRSLVPNLRRAPIREQLLEQRQWLEALKADKASRQC